MKPIDSENNETMESLEARAGRDWRKEPTAEEAALTYATTAMVGGGYYLCSTALRTFRAASAWHVFSRPVTPDLIGIASHRYPNCVCGANQSYSCTCPPEATLDPITRVAEILRVVRKVETIDRDWLIEVLTAPVFSEPSTTPLCVHCNHRQGEHSSEGKNCPEWDGNGRRFNRTKTYTQDARIFKMKCAEGLHPDFVGNFGLCPECPREKQRVALRDTDDRE